MLFEKPAELKYVIGFDLRDDFCQISYADRTMTGKEPVTFSLSPNEERFDIPTALYKAAGVNQWAAGADAAQMSSDGSGTYIPRLLSLAMEGSKVEVEGASYEAAALLALFIRRCLALLEKVISPKEIQAVMFTAREMDRKMIGILEDVRKRLDLRYAVYYESYASSFYNFLLMQPKILREPASFLCEYEKGGRLRITKLHFNIRTTPIVGYCDETVYPGIFAHDAEGKDSEFLSVLSRELTGLSYQSVFLIGNGFKGDWMKKSISYICRGRRAFMGNNLYSKGAAWGALFRIKMPEAEAGYFFLDKNKVQTNIGIRGYNRGELAACLFLEAGCNWYEVDRTQDIILEDSNEIRLLMRPLRGGETSEFLIRLDGLPVREGRTARIRLHFTMSAPDKLEILIEDMGFGDIFPSSGLKWEQQINL